MADKLTLRQLRKRQGITQVQMAERMGIAQESLSRIERAKGVKVETVERYVDALGGDAVLVARLAGNEVELSLP